MKKQGFSGLPSYVSLAFLRGRHIYFVKVPSWTNPFCMDVLQIQSTLSFQENKFWIFSPASRPPISKPMLLPKGEYPEKYKLIISRGHQSENFDWNVSPELAGVTHGITLPGNRTFLFTSDQYWRLLPGSFLKFNLLPFHNPFQEYCSGWVRKPWLPS